ncbi:hypothetical protein RND81_02G011600 [Saponaria officinalis]|uniref:NAB domain-containing protein n=1 Tax=Saponaria officinalis TaxID=3572 RepID=A0AAW1MJS9_SAPOF
MAVALSRSETRKMYSWWWDSHISPKNSKWLQENLTDMDSKVKSMIKIIEVDEDTFARRAEMYYKKRPELMKLVEEFYRAYRALAERYDHATGVIRQAHTTMAEVFPNQVPFVMHDDAPVNITHDYDPRTPEMQNGDVGVSTSDFTNESDSLASRKESKQLDGIEKARKGLNFQEIEERDDMTQTTQFLSESERLVKSESDIQALKNALAKFEAEKENGLIEYQKTLERLSKLEFNFSQAKQDSDDFNECADKAEAEMQSLKESLAKVEVEREASLTQYRECLDRIADLESRIARKEENAGKLNDVVTVLLEELSQTKAEKETLLTQYMESLEKLANLENKLLLAEDFVSSATERAEKAEKEVDMLKETIMKLTEEKDTAVLKYEQSLEKIATLEREITVIQEKAEKLKESEELCVELDRSNKSLLSEVDSLEHKIGIQNEELSEKQRELGRLWTCVQEERMRFMDTEAGFKSLQNLHSKVQVELRSVANELQKKVQLLKELENQKQRLEDEVQKVKDENKRLDDLNLSSVDSMKSMREEILGLKDGKEKLKLELELRLEERNALQQEIYCLKQDLDSLSQRHRDLSRQVESVGFDPESVGSSVKKLQDENSKLKESCQNSTTEISGLVERLSVMERLVQKNTVLEKSLSDLSAELDGARAKVEELEESCQLLMGEKSAVVTEKGTLEAQLQMTTENLEKLSQRNTLLENCLFDVNADLEMLRLKSKNLEESCKALNDRNSALVAEKEMLACELDLTHRRLVDLGKIHVELEEKYSSLEEERKSTLQKVDALQFRLASEKQEHADSNQLSQTRIADLENEIRHLREEGDNMREEFEEELDNAVDAQFEIFVLHKCIQDLKENNFSLLRYCEKVLEASRMSEKLISELENEKLDQRDEVKVLKTGLYQLLDALEADVELLGDENGYDDQRFIDLILVKLDDIKASLYEACDENNELAIQKSVLVEVILQLKEDVSDLNSVIYAFKQEIESRNMEVLLQQKETRKLLESNEELILKVREGNMKEATLLAQVENLQHKLLNLQKAYADLQKENIRVIEGNKSLIFTVEGLVEEVVDLDNLSFIFKNVISEKSKDVTELTQTIDKLCNENNILDEKVRSIERNLEDARNKDIDFEFSLKKSKNELEEVLVVNAQLKNEVDNGRDLLCLKEMELLREESVKLRQGHQILELSESYAQKLNECEDLRQLIQNLDSQISKMKKEHEESETKVRVLSSELQKGKDEVKLWETVAGTFFSELQSSSLREALINEKFAELVKTYEALEGESDSKCMDISRLKTRVEALEGENSEIKARLAADLSAVVNLKGSVASLEKHAMSFRKINHVNIGEKEDFEDGQNLNESQSVGSVNLREVQVRIHDVEKAVIELKQHAQDQYSSVRSDLNSALQQIDVLKFQRSRFNGSARLSRRVPCPSHSSEEPMMKDIELDQASDCSPCGQDRKVMEHVFGSWEPKDRSSKFDLFSESLAERDLGVDEQSSSKRSRTPQVDDNTRKTLERLASDVQKLVNLQITVQDLKEKLEMSESSSLVKAKVVERDGMKEQLVEAEQTISKLLDYSAKVMKNIENSSSTPSSSSVSFDGVPAADVSDGSARRKKSKDQARKISEKIGRLQFEMQKIHFRLIKHNSNNNSKLGKGGFRRVERSTRVLLRDYLYGGPRTPRRQKRTLLFGCVQADTKGSE